MKKGKISIVTAIFIAVSLALVSANITLEASLRYYDSRLNSLSEKERLYNKFSVISDIFDAQYIGEPDWENMREYALYGYVSGSGDRYASYIGSEEFKKFTSSSSGEMVGIGVNTILDAETGLIRIVDVYGGSPAQEAGVMAGDLIYMVEGKPAIELGYYNTISLMLGKENTAADFTVLRNSEEVEFSIKRAVIQVDPVVYRIIGGDLGYIKISDFNSKTYPQFENAIMDLTSDERIKGLVFDVRNNSGGAVDSIVSVLDRLMGEGEIVSMVDKQGEREVFTSDARETDIPMTVLVNENTVSAAELFAAALQDCGKAKVVGKKTFGKGTEVIVIPLNDGTAVSLSDRYYYTPSGRNLENNGVEPDYEADLDMSSGKSLYEMNENDDTQLIEAIRVIRLEIARVAG